MARKKRAAAMPVPAATSTVGTAEEHIASGVPGDVLKEADRIFHRLASEAIMSPLLCRKAIALALADNQIGIAFGSVGYFILEQDENKYGPDPLARIGTAVAIDVHTAKKLVMELTQIVVMVEGQNNG